MTFAWQTHAGDRAGVRLSFVPKLADIVPISVEVVLPVADDVDIQYGNSVLSARLPLFYWKTDISPEQPLQRGANTVLAPKGATMLELGVHRNLQKQIIDNEYVYLVSPHNNHTSQYQHCLHELLCIVFHTYQDLPSHHHRNK